MNPGARNGRATYDVVCVSHLRWDFVFQRPQHLLVAVDQVARQARGVLRPQHWKLGDRHGHQIAVPLAMPTPFTGSASGCTNAARALVKSILMHPEDYYVNVHTITFPSGAISGVLAKGT